MATQKTISVTTLANCNDESVKIAESARQAAWTIVDRAHSALAANKVDSYADIPIPELLDIGSIICLNQFNPELSRNVVLARGFQTRDIENDNKNTDNETDPRPTTREIYAIAKLVPERAAVADNATISVVLRSAVLPYPSWDVGERVYVDGAGIEVEVDVKARRWVAERDDWEFLLFERGAWETKRELEETFEAVLSMDVLPESSSGSDREEDEDDDDDEE